jgi:hypothetical protein
LRNSLIISFTLALGLGVYLFGFFVSRLMHNDFLTTTEPVYKSLVQLKADFESFSVTEAQRAQDLRQAGLLVSKFQADYSPASRIHGVSSTALGDALNRYREAYAQRNANAVLSRAFKLSGDRSLAEARKQIDAGN